MRDRVARLLAERAGGVTIGTFHRTCAEMLRWNAAQAGLDRNFPIFDAADQLAVVRTAMKDLGLTPTQVSPVAARAGISRAKDELRTHFEYAEYAEGHIQEMIARIYRRYEQLLAESGGLDFGDLIMRAVNLLKDSPEVLEYYHNRYRFVMVDEYQDTNRAQYVLVRELCKSHRNLCVVGDDDQSIYGWRGSGHPQLAGVRERISGREGRQARAELPLDRDDPGSGARRRFAASRTQAEEAMDGARGRRRHPRRGGIRRGGRGAPRSHGIAGGRGPGRAARGRRDHVPDQRAVASVRGSLRAGWNRLPACGRDRVLPAAGNQGHAGLSSMRGESERFGELRADCERARAGNRRKDARRAGAMGVVEVDGARRGGPNPAQERRGRSLYARREGVNAAGATVEQAG